MKVKNFILIGIVAVTAMALTSCDVRFGIEDRHGNKQQAEAGVVDEEIAIDGIRKIDMKLGAANIQINSYDGEKITVKSKGDFIGYKSLSVRTSGETVIIEDNGHDIGSLNGVSFNGERSLEINIPKKYDKDIDMKLGAGNVDINNIKINKFIVEGGAGNIDISNVVFANLILNQGVGNIDVSLKDKCGDITVKGGVGNLDLEIGEVGGNLKYNGGIGETDIKIPENSPVQIKTTSGLGKVEVNAKTSGNTYMFDLKLGLGSVTVN